MWYKPETINIERNLVEYCLTGKNKGIPGTNTEGLKQYRQLLRNNIASILENAFPITNAALSMEKWEFLLDKFHSQHAAQTPQIWKLPLEFVNFCSENRFSEKMELPFLNDLLKFEWVEIEVHTMQNIYPEPYEKQGNIASGQFIVNPEYQITRLEFPVHIYSAEASVDHKGEYFLLTYRMPVEYEVRFMDLAPLHVYYFNKLANEQYTADKILDEVLETSGQRLNIQELRNNLLDFITTLLKEKILLGYKHMYHN